MIVSDRLFPSYLSSSIDEEAWPLFCALDSVPYSGCGLDGYLEHLSAVIPDVFSASFLPSMSPIALDHLEMVGSCAPFVVAERERRHRITKEYRITEKCQYLQRQYRLAEGFKWKRPRASATRDIAAAGARLRTSGLLCNSVAAATHCIHLPISLWTEAVGTKTDDSVWRSWQYRPIDYDRAPWVDTLTIPFPECFLGFGAWIEPKLTSGLRGDAFGGMFIDNDNVFVVTKDRSTGQVRDSPVQWGFKKKDGDDLLLGEGYDLDPLSDVVFGSFGSAFFSRLLRLMVRAASTHELPVVRKDAGGTLHRLGDKKRELPEPGYQVLQQPLQISKTEAMGLHRSPEYRFDVRGHWAHRIRRMMGELTDAERYRWERRETGTCRYRFIQHPASQADQTYLREIGRPSLPGKGQYLRITEFWVRGHVRGPDESEYIPSTKVMGPNLATRMEQP